jgi:hypothetical protein
VLDTEASHHLLSETKRRAKPPKVAYE